MGYSLKLINVLHLYGWDFIKIDVSQIGLFLSTVYGIRRLTKILKSILVA